MTRKPVRQKGSSSTLPKKRKKTEPRFRTGTEKELMRVLWANRDKFLPRSLLHEQMSPQTRPTTSRIGQLLSSLYDFGYVNREVDRYQGASKVFFCRLSDKGKDKCDELGIGGEGQVLFQQSPEHHREWLTLKSLSVGFSPHHRLIGFYSYSGGLGRTTLAAYVARALAERNPSKRVLLIDFDLEAPELDRFFSVPDEPEVNRGLRGLVCDYFFQKDWQRQTWLAQALSPESFRFVVTPVSDLDNFHFLPSGMRGAGDAASAAEAARAMRHLQNEAWSSSPKENATEQTLLANLYEHLQQAYDFVLMDSHSGRSLSGSLVTRLADRLCLSIRPSDRSLNALEGLKSVLTTFLADPDKNRRHWKPGNLFVFHISPSESPGFEAQRWVSDHLRESSEATRATHFPCAVIPYEPRVGSDRVRKPETLFAPVTRALLGDEHQNQFLPPELSALRVVLDPKESEDWRKMSLNALGRASMLDLIKHLDWYLKDPELRVRSDPWALSELETLLERKLGKLLADLKDAQDKPREIP